MSTKWDAEGYQSRHSYVFQYGESLIDMLEPQPGERILDLGCGAGQLTSSIADHGATVFGLDRSPDMIAQAAANFPNLEFRVADAAAFSVEEPVDAVFSNAALHWVKDAQGAIECVWNALRPGGRFVVEMGGNGNIRAVEAAVREVIGPNESPWYFPTLSEYAGLLEKRGFEVIQAVLSDRPTRVEGEDGMEHWLGMFGSLLLQNFDEDRRREIRCEVANKLRQQCFRDGGWVLDYRRLRIVATKPA